MSSAKEEDLSVCIYVDSPHKHKRFVQLLAGIVNGVVKTPRIVKSKWGNLDDIYVEQNDDYDPKRQDEIADYGFIGFLFYRYAVEIDPVGAVGKLSCLEKDDRDAYVSRISDILRQLRGAGYKVVAACNFEDELPK